MQNHKTNLLRRAFLLGGAAATSLVAAGTARADGDIISTLTTTTTTAITALVTAMGTILVAAFVIPVGKRAYSAFKSFLGKAS